MASSQLSEDTSDVQVNRGEPDHAGVVVSIADQIVTWWNRPVFSAYSQILLLFVMVGICIVRAYTGLSGMKIATQDAFPILDGAWRIMCGQRPHLDFYTGLGPFIYLECAAGLLFAGGAEGYGYAQAAFGVVVGLWAFFAAGRRVGGLARALLCVFVVLLVTAPTNIGDLPRNLSPDMVYNRYGFALLVILLIEAFCSTRVPRRFDDLFGGISTGAIVGLLLFLKVTYFVAAVVLLLALFQWRKQTQQRLLGLAVGFVLMCFPFVVFLRFNLLPMFSDLHLMAGARFLNAFKIVWFLLQTLQQNLVPFAAFVLGMALWQWCYRETTLMRKTVVALLAVCGIGVFLVLTNAQQSGLPLNVAMAIILSDTVMWRIRGYHFAPPVDLLRSVAVFSLVAGTVLVVAVPLLYDGLAIADGGYERWAIDNGKERYIRFKAARFAGYRDFEKEIVKQFNGGADLLRQNRKPNETVSVLNFSNPYSYALDVKPAYGGTTWLQWNINLNDAHKPDAKWLFGNTDLLLVPTCYDQPFDNDNLPRVYGPYIRQNFTQIAETKLWKLYRRTAKNAAS